MIIRDDIIIWSGQSSTLRSTQDSRAKNMIVAGLCRHGRTLDFAIAFLGRLVSSLALSYHSHSSNQRRGHRGREGQVQTAWQHLFEIPLRPARSRKHFEFRYQFYPFRYSEPQHSVFLSMSSVVFCLTCLRLSFKPITTAALNVPINITSEYRLETFINYIPIPPPTVKANINATRSSRVRS